MIKDLIKGKFHESAGGIIFCSEKNQIKIPLLKTIDNNWMIPKGHIKEKENPKQTAIREIKEELGINKDLIYIGKIGIDNFTFKLPKDKNIYSKKVHIFLFTIVRKAKINPNVKEKFIEAKWFNFNNACQKLSPSIFTKTRFVKINKKIINNKCDINILFKAKKMYDNFILINNKKGR